MFMSEKFPSLSSLFCANFEMQQIETNVPNYDLRSGMVAIASGKTKASILLKCSKLWIMFTIFFASPMIVIVRPSELNAVVRIICQQSFEIDFFAAER